MFRTFIFNMLVLTIFCTGSAQETWQATGKPTALTPGDKHLIQPIWSPDGEKIAMSGDSYRGIWVMNADGTELLGLSKARGAGFNFSWSSDSREIVSLVNQYKGRRKVDIVKIFDVEANTSRVIKEYASGVRGRPKWTPDNRHVYITTKDGLDMLDSKRTGTVKKHSVDNAQPIFYTASGEMILADSEGRPLSKLKPVDGQYLNPVLSPDGKKIAFEVLGGNLYVVRIDGTGLVDLGRGERPRWSPDSQWLTYMIPSDDGHQILSSDIFVIKIDGTGKTNLTNTQDRLEMNPDWAPDGQSIIYDEKRTGRIYKLRIDKQ